MTPADLKYLETQIWKSADDLRANPDLAANEYDTPVLGLIFLKFADGKFKQQLPAIQAEYDKLKGGRREKPIECNCKSSRATGSPLRSALQTKRP